MQYALPIYVYLFIYLQILSIKYYTHYRTDPPKMEWLKNELLSFILYFYALMYCVADFLGFACCILKTPGEVRWSTRLECALIWSRMTFFSPLSLPLLSRISSKDVNSFISFLALFSLTTCLWWKKSFKLESCGTFYSISGIY